ncbi:endo alpha-1,4 polygalactosaminidase [Cellulomonas soli]|uniref:endo alpha-1,4 polygalactosaminidase n=1 Tax=Cellulomonas soli TaxID=931535 RepID=UPI003F84BCFD
MTFPRILRPVRRTALGPVVGTLASTVALTACGPAADPAPSATTPTASSGRTSSTPTAATTTTPTVAPSEAPPTAPAAAPTDPAGLPAGGTADYQLGGAYPPPPGTTIVARDSTESPAAGTYGICYVNGFQSQPGDSDRWAARGLLLLDDTGEPVVDDGWPDEMLLDTSTEHTRAGIADELSTELARCAAAGFDAVEYDNLDSWTRADGRLTQDDAVALATLLVRAAHDLGLAAAQKNTPQLGTAGRDTIGFDLVVAEECLTYDECAAYTDVYGQDVIDIEYVDAGQDAADLAAQVCAAPGRPARLVIRDHDLAPAGSAGHAYAACPSTSGR